MVQVMAVERPSPRVVRDPIKGELLHRFHQHGIFQRPVTGPVLYLEGMPVQVDRVGHHAHIGELKADKPIRLKGNLVRLGKHLAIDRPYVLPHTTAECDRHYLIWFPPAGWNNDAWRSFEHAVT